MNEAPPRPSVWLLGLLTAIVAFAIDVYLPALPQVARDLDTTTASAGLTLTALLLGIAGGQVLGGPWSDVRGRREPIIVGCFLYGVAALLCAAAPSVWLLVAMRFTQGFVGAFCIVGGRAVVRDVWEGAEAARVYSRLTLVLGVAPVFAPMVGALVLQVTSWRGVFVGLAAFGFALAAMAARWLPETLPVERRRGGGLRTTLRSYRSLLHDREYVLVVLSASIGYGALFVYLAGSSFVLQDRFGLTEVEFALAFGINGVLFVVMAQVGAALVRRTGARRLVLLGAGIEVLAGLVLVSGEAWGLPAVLLGFLLVTTAMGFIPPNATALALAGHPAQAGAAAALLGLATQLSAAVIQPVVSVGGTPTPLRLGTVVVVCGLGCFACVVLSHAQARHVELADLEG